MMRANDHDKKLEQLIGRVLRAQPLRRAPSELGLRVLTEIERRTTLPWWRNNFAHWPFAVRAAFVAASCGLVRLALSAAMWVAALQRSSQIADTLKPVHSWMHGGSSIISVTAGVVASVMRAVPPYWLYGGIAVTVALYAALFGLGAVAYRTLYVTR